MKFFPLLALAILIGIKSYAQIETPLVMFLVEQDRVSKETDSGKYYASPAHPEHKIFVSDDMYYRLLTPDDKVVAEGTLSMNGDKYMLEGKWTEYYDNGKIKNTGFYLHNKLVGSWQQYYPGGHLRSVCNYALIENKATYTCKAGNYMEYFENGHLKTAGMYKAVIDASMKDTVLVENPDTGQMTTKITSGDIPHAEKCGRWEYYNEQGELVKKEDL